MCVVAWRFLFLSLSLSLSLFEGEREREQTKREREIETTTNPTIPWTKREKERERADGATDVMVYTGYTAWSSSWSLFFLFTDSESLWSNQSGLVAICCRVNW